MTRLNDNLKLQINSSSKQSIYKKINYKDIKNKIKKGSYYNAFNKLNLGSIPSKHENILIDTSILNNKGFNSSCKKLLNYNINEYNNVSDINRCFNNIKLKNIKKLNNDKNSFIDVIDESQYNSKNIVSYDINNDNKHLYKNSKCFIDYNNNNNNNNTSYTLKSPPIDSFIKHSFNYKLNPLTNYNRRNSLINKNIETKQRFSDKTLYNRKFLPGPGEYKSNNLIEYNVLKDKANIKYKRIFKKDYKSINKNKVINKFNNNNLLPISISHKNIYKNANIYNYNNRNSNINSNKTNKKYLNKTHNIIKGSLSINKSKEVIIKRRKKDNICMDPGYYHKDILKIGLNPILKNNKYKVNTRVFIKGKFNNTFSIIFNNDVSNNIKFNKITKYLVDKELNNEFKRICLNPCIGQYSPKYNNIENINNITEVKCKYKLPLINKNVNKLNLISSKNNDVSNEKDTPEHLIKIKKRKEVNSINRNFNVLKDNVKYINNKLSYMFVSKSNKKYYDNNHNPGPAYYKVYLNYKKQK